MRDLGYGRGYVYPHDKAEEAERQTYLPEALVGRRFLDRK
jgi:replication-associated recombination protein RarA